MKFERSETCCFTGHRDISDAEKNRASDEIRRLVTQLCRRGVVRYIVGGALGFDTAAAVTLINLRDSGEPCLFGKDGKPVRIHITAAIPCLDQSAKWRLSDRVLYDSIMRSVDEKVVLHEKYVSGCMHERNRYMVDNSAYCIAFVRKKTGGSYYTMNYAEKSGLETVNISNGFRA